MCDDDLNCNYNITGINAQFGYNATNSDNCTCSRKELLSNIQDLYFAITELGLYLNTHPTDEKALCLHQEYTNTLKDLMEKYQRAFGPLSIYYPCNKWKWLNNPWPWERSEM